MPGVFVRNLTLQAPLFNYRKLEVDNDFTYNLPFKLFSNPLALSDR